MAGKEVLYPFLSEPQRDTIARVEETAHKVYEKRAAHHGTGHALRVAEMGAFIASSEGADPFRVMAAALIHDVEKWKDEELEIRGITVLDSEKTHLTPKVILEGFFNEGSITETDYSEVIRAIQEHSNKSDTASPFATVRCLRDADKLSRSGIEGLVSIVDTNKDYNLTTPTPFHQAGKPIIPIPTQGVLPNSEIHSATDDIVACLSWRNALETETGKALEPALNRVNVAFLDTVAQFPDKVSYDDWLPWLQSITAKLKPQYEAARALVHAGRFDEYRKRLIEIENPQLVSKEAYESFLQTSTN